MKKLLLFSLLISIIHTSNSQDIAFPGAEGGGKFTTGGRGGKIIFVDNLNDKGDGSFRKAIESSGPRTIIFRVSGNIELNKAIHIKNGDLTIAGQTAPGDGICLVNYGMRVDADNVIIRFIRVRPGDKIQEETDAITGLRHNNIIIDHCSFSWANDEVASFYDNTDFTMQWCIISESFYKSSHHKGEHGYGGIWGGLNASFHHNLITDHSSRNPRFCGSRYTMDSELEKTDFRNNVIYNWGSNTAYGGEDGNYNMVNNYYKPGPATKKSVQNRILELTQSFFDPDFSKDTLGAGKFYVTGNIIFRDRKTTRNNWEYGVDVDQEYTDKKDLSLLKRPILHTSIPTECAIKAYKNVLKNAGASLTRDFVDQRIIEETKTGKELFGNSFGDGNNGIIDSQSDVNGWPELNSQKPPVDTDNDGMPDEWETKKGLNPQSSNDSEAISLHTSYTNIEMYINELVNRIIK